MALIAAALGLRVLRPHYHAVTTGPIFRRRRQVPSTVRLNLATPDLRAPRSFVPVCVSPPQSYPRTFPSPSPSRIQNSVSGTLASMRERVEPLVCRLDWSKEIRGAARQLTDWWLGAAGAGGGAAVRGL